MNTGNIEAIYPLSPMQQGMLFHSLYAPASGVYIEQMRWVFCGTLNVEAFKHTWERILDRHAVLRTLFTWEHREKPLQVVRQHVALPWEVLDWTALAPVLQHKQLETWLQADRVRGFDLATAPLMRLTLIQLSATTCQFVWTHHHLLLDGWSMALLLKEVFALYDAECRGTEILLQNCRPYQDYITWLKQCDLKEAEAFWRENLQGFATPLSLPKDTVSGDAQPKEDTYAVQEQLLTRKMTQAVLLLCQRYQVTISLLMQGVWALLLHRYTGEKDIVFGVTTSGRPPDLAGIEAMIGMFINTVPMRVTISPQEGVEAWLRSLQKQVARVRHYEYSPLVEVQGWSDIPRGAALFESVVVCENYPRNPIMHKLTGNLNIQEINVFEKTNYPLTVVVEPGQELMLRISYDQQLFDPTTITRMLGHMQTLLESLSAHPDQRIEELSLLTEAEQEQLLVTWNAISTQSEEGHCIHHLFEAQVERNPQQVALIFEEQRYDYAALNARGNQVAHGLKSMGIGHGQSVAVLLTEGPLQVITLLGILKAGSAFVCLDVHSPEARLQQIMEELEPDCVIIDAACFTLQRRLFQQIEQRSALHVIILDGQQEQLVGTNYKVDDFTTYPATNLTSAVRPDDRAYIAYTSGSTGVPKGIIQTHNNLCQFIGWLSQQFAIRDSQRIAQWASLTFDAAYVEIFGALCFGATICMTTAATRWDPSALIAWIQREHIALLQVVPSYLRQLLRVTASLQSADDQQLFAHLKTVLVAGEVVSVELADEWLKQFPSTPELFNLYGATESILATYYPIERTWPNQRSIPIGRAIAGRQILILDQEDRLCPVGVIGQIYIRSPYLAPGYLRRSDETQSAFLQNPLHDRFVDRVYRTGDLGRRLSDGVIEFCGRLDQQVKIRGMRVELEDIETALYRHVSIQECVVVMQSDEAGDQRLIAYIVPRRQSTLYALTHQSKEEEEKKPQREVEQASYAQNVLREHLRQWVPEHMVPATFLLLDTLPLTVNGKVDRQALLLMPQGVSIPQEYYVAPRTSLEEALVEIWAKVLNRKPMGVCDDFFQLGGQSLLATQVISRIRDTFQVNLALRSLFDTPTVAGLAKQIEELQQAKLADADILSSILEKIRSLSDDEASKVLTKGNLSDETYR